MKIWFPENLSESDKTNVSDYILKCKIYLYRFKSILRSNIILTKWDVVETKLLDSDIISNKSENFKLMNIPYQYINCLDCFYDYGYSRCYYSISPKTRCYGSTNNLDDTIRLIEYGNDIIPPIGWIRHSYLMFIDIVLGGVVA